jgi:hypothetical protein
MKIILLVFAYIAIVASMLVKVACYPKKMANLKTNIFSFSILLIIKSITVSLFFGERDANNTTNIFCVSAPLLDLTAPIFIISNSTLRISFFSNGA